MNKRLLVSLVVLLATSPALLADDSAMGGLGGNVAPLKPGHTQIRMVDEVVRVTDVEAGTVDATFTFRNEGPAVDMLIGFPSYSGGDSGGTFDSFRCWVDGHEVPVTQQFTDEAGEDSIGEHITWFTKHVHFDAKQSRIVHDIYSGGGGGDSSGNKWFSYVLHTGANWKGPICRARLFINMAQLDRYSPVDVSCAYVKRVGSQLVMDRRNFEPTAKDDVYIDWYPAFREILINGKRDPNYTTDGTYKTGGVFVKSGDEIENLTDRWREIAGSAPVRRGNDIWLPAKLAAYLIGGRLHIVEAGKRCQIIRGNRTVNIVTGDAKIMATDGRSYSMPYPATYVAENSWIGYQNDRPYTMVALGTVIQAFGGKWRLTRNPSTFTATLPGIARQKVN